MVARSDPAFTARALDEGLKRAIVSLHSHDVATSCDFRGQRGRPSWDSWALRSSDAGVWTMLNCVVTTHNGGTSAITSGGVLRALAQAMS